MNSIKEGSSKIKFEALRYALAAKYPLGSSSGWAPPVRTCGNEGLERSAERISREVDLSRRWLFTTSWLATPGTPRSAAALFLMPNTVRAATCRRLSSGALKDLRALTVQVLACALASSRKQVTSA